MFVELSVVEQRYQAVLAVIRDGVPVVEVASRFGVSRQAVHRWLTWYEDQGLAGLVDHRTPLRLPQALLGGSRFPVLSVSSGEVRGGQAGPDSTEPG
jgi:hypothetical protein